MAAGGAMKFVIQTTSGIQIAFTVLATVMPFLVLWALVRMQGRQQHASAAEALVEATEARHAATVALMEAEVARRDAAQARTECLHAVRDLELLRLQSNDASPRLEIAPRRSKKTRQRGKARTPAASR